MQIRILVKCHKSGVFLNYTHKWKELKGLLFNIEFHYFWHFDFSPSIFNANGGIETEPWKVIWRVVQALVVESKSRCHFASTSVTADCFSELFHPFTGFQTPQELSVKWCFFSIPITEITPCTLRYGLRNIGIHGEWMTVRFQIC